MTIDSVSFVAGALGWCYVHTRSALVPNKQALATSVEVRRYLTKAVFRMMCRHRTFALGGAFVRRSPLLSIISTREAARHSTSGSFMDVPR